MVTRKEYLEKLLADSYKKENDGEENVARSLPFFAASLALLAATLGAIRTEAPPLDITRESLVFWILIALIFVAIGFVLFHLYQAVRPRSFKYLSKESELVEYSIRLEEYYTNCPPSGQTIDDAVIGDLRENLIKQYATSTENNRIINSERSLARGRAASALIVGIALAFILIGAILINKTGIFEHSPLGEGAEVPIDPPEAPNATIPKADAAGNAARRERGVGLEREDSAP